MFDKLKGRLVDYWNKPVEHTDGFMCECDNCILIDRKRMKKIMKELRNE